MASSLPGPVMDFSRNSEILEFFPKLCIFDYGVASRGEGTKAQLGTVTAIPSGFSWRIYCMVSVAGSGIIRGIAEAW
jgi:hypothetical protein